MEQKALQLLNDEQMKTFISQGFLILKTDFSDEFHSRLLGQLDYVYEKEGNPGNNLLPRIRELQVVFDSPVIKGALTSVLGANYMMHTHRYGHLNKNPVPGNWHKDSYWGYKRLRNHKPWWAMIMYFPQDTPLELGPTGVMPGTQYHESRIFENDDNEWEGKASGSAGTFALIHYDIWHRSNANMMGQQRYMLKFEFMRTEAPTAPTWDCADTEWHAPAEFDIPMDRHDLLWENNWNWLAGKGGYLSGRKSDSSSADLNELEKQLGNEDRRVRAEAANQLGLHADEDAGRVRRLLEAALQDSYEPVRLNAAYGLAADGTAGTAILLDAIRNEDKKIAEAAAYALSASGPSAAEGLIGLLDDGKELTVNLAAFALGELGVSGD
ncbi:HEAT repeat domain-containing protein, partial [Paenibacillus sepulcri]|nr:HEAT repeat domain-containing protein [Paenibacillus sepulcri]